MVFAEFVASQEVMQALQRSLANTPAAFRLLPVQAIMQQLHQAQRPAEVHLYFPLLQYCCGVGSRPPDDGTAEVGQ